MRFYKIIEDLKHSIADSVSFTQEYNNLPSDLQFSQKTQKISLNLISFFAEKNSNFALQLAQILNSFEALFEAAQIIKETSKDFSRSLLLNVYKRGFVFLESSNQLSPQLKSKWLLKYAEAFHFLEATQMKDEAFRQAASSGHQQNTLIDVVESLLAIAQTYKKIGDEENFECIFSEARKQLLLIKDTPDSYQTRLKLASFYYNCQEYDLALTTFNTLSPFKDPEEDEKIIDLLPLAELTEKISSNHQIIKGFSTDTPGFIDLKFEQVKKLPHNWCRFSDYLEISSAYQKLKKQEKAEEALNCALEAFKAILPEDKVDMHLEDDLIKLMNQFEKTSPETTQKLLQLLKNWYADQNSSVNKDDAAIAILNLCNKNNLKEQSDEFFKNYFADLTQQTTDPCQHIENFTKAARLNIEEGPNQGFSQEQHKRMLKAAEDLISKVPARRYEEMLAMIAKGYLNVDPKKCPELFNQYGRHRGFEHLRIAAITAIGAGVTYISPKAGTCLALGFGVYRTFRPL